MISSSFHSPASLHLLSFTSQSLKLTLLHFLASHLARIICQSCGLKWLVMYYKLPLLYFFSNGVSHFKNVLNALEFY